MNARGAPTRARILDAAERLVADQGIEATSLRAVTTAAKVNLAAVNYHFGSKDALIVAVYSRRVGPINQQRLALLDSAEAATGGPTLESVLASYIEPTLRLVHGAGKDGQMVMRLLGRALYEPGGSVCQLMSDEMKPVLDRFSTALARCLPGLPMAELFWRMHFTGGALAYTLVQNDRLALLSGGLCDGTDIDGTCRRLVAFTAAGLRAALSADAGSR
jgi:AcrR family transcriptional regulator